MRVPGTELGLSAVVASTWLEELPLPTLLLDWLQVGPSMAMVRKHSSGPGKAVSSGLLTHNSFCFVFPALITNDRPAGKAIKNVIGGQSWGRAYTKDVIGGHDEGGITPKMWLEDMMREGLHKRCDWRTFEGGLTPKKWDWRTWLREGLHIQVHSSPLGSISLSVVAKGVRSG